ncbi:T6SS effector BTH_I2691 family protein [Salinicola avicenniae]|uniref:T6SS effector BTH_I2691 family protein n=1 Tax=Salinicola avicenniae TaxID=2916836 RepID=UPI00255CAB21|nr:MULTISPECIES: T6SS effector BTH_I2691 family protein [unclassified Salinicola]
MTAQSRASDHAAKNEASGQESGRCQFCERKGLPILPVRYAVCQRNDRNNDIPELETSRIQEFTDILLDKSLVGGEEQGRSVPDEVKAEITQSTGSQVNKYILRQLRQGYLYFYDQDNPNGMHWYAYAITSDGKYYQFPVLQPPALDEIVFPERCQSNSSDALHASLVTLPDPDNSGVIYYAFTEHAWPNEHIRMIGSDAEWRESNMQKVDISSWVAGQAVQPFTFSTDELEKVAEYSAGAHDLSTQFWSSGPHRKIYEPRQLKDAMNLRLDHAASQYQGKGLILAVKDEVGIMEELNAYRHQALAQAENFINRSEDNRRKLLCKKAIDAFKSNFRKGYIPAQRKKLDDAIEDAKNKRDEYLEEGSSGEEISPRVRAQRQRELGRLNQSIRDAEQDKEDFLAELDREKAACDQERRRVQEELEELEASNANYDEHLRQQAEGYRSEGRYEAAEAIERRRQVGPLDTQISNKRIQLANVKTDAERAADRHADQLDELYDKKTLDEFYQNYEEQNAVCQETLSLHDSDYSIWVRKHLGDVVARYSKTDYWMGLGLSGLVGNVLRGGILSPGSGSLWQSMTSALNSNNSTLMAAIFANNAELIAQAQSCVRALPESQQLPRETLASWGGEFREIQQRSVMLNGDAPSRDQIINRFRPIQSLLSMTVGNSIASLSLYGTAGLSVGELKPFLRCFIRYHQLAFMADPDAQSGEQAVPRLVNVDIKLSELYQWLRSVARQNESDSERGVDLSRAMKSLDGATGNFAAPLADRNRVIRIALPDYVADILKASGDDKPLLLQGSYTWEDGQQRQQDFNDSARDVGNTLVSARQGYGQIAGVCLVLWNLVSAVEAEAFVDDEDGADWSKILSTGVGLASSAMAGIEGYQSIRAASLGVSPGSAIANNADWVFAGRTMAVVGGLISIWDGMNKLTEAVEASKTGGSLSAKHGMILGGFGVVSGVVSIILIGASTGVGLVVSIFVGVLALLLGWLFVTMVSPAVEMWINRSILGYASAQGDMQVLPFEDMDSEQSSLEMVFQGVLVKLSWSQVLPNTTEYIESRDEVDKEGMSKEIERARSLVEVGIVIKVPDLNGVELRLQLAPRGESLRTIFDWAYKSQSSSGGLSFVKESEYSRSRDRSSSNRPEFFLKDEVYETKWAKVYPKAILGELVDLVVSFKSGGGVSRDFLTLSL